MSIKVLYPCCIPQVGCVPMEDEAECVAAGGEHNIYDCGDPRSQCVEEDVGPLEPDGCYSGPPVWLADSDKLHHTLDICERTVAEPTFITDEPPVELRLEPVSSHLSRGQPVGAGQDPCAINEGFLTIDDEGTAEFLMCTGRGYSNVGYAAGVLVIPRRVDESDGEDQEPLEQAEILFATEAPFPLELNLFSDGYPCNGYPI